MTEIRCAPGRAGRVRTVKEPPLGYKPPREITKTAVQTGVTKAALTHLEAQGRRVPPRRRGELVGAEVGAGGLGRRARAPVRREPADQVEPTGQERRAVLQQLEGDDAEAAALQRKAVPR